MSFYCCFISLLTYTHIPFSHYWLEPVSKHFTVRSTYTCCIRRTWQIHFDLIWFEISPAQLFWITEGWKKREWVAWSICLRWSVLYQCHYAVGTNMLANIWLAGWEEWCLGSSSSSKATITWAAFNLLLFYILIQDEVVTLICQYSTFSFRMR